MISTQNNHVFTTIAVLLALLASGSALFAQVSVPWEEHPTKLIAGPAGLSKVQSFYQSVSSPWLDVTYYRLQLKNSGAEIRRVRKRNSRGIEIDGFEGLPTIRATLISRRCLQDHRMARDFGQARGVFIARFDFDAIS